MQTLNELFFGAVDEFDRTPLLSQVRNGSPVDYSTRQFKTAVLALACFFRKQGLQPGQCVAILAENSPEWHISDFATQVARLVTVPIYTAFAPSQIGYVLEHSESSVLIVSGREMWEKVRASGCSLPEGASVIAIESWEGMPAEVLLLRSVVAEYTQFVATAEPELRRDALRTDSGSAATIVYTSGTTGPPKGVVLTHRNLITNLRQGIRRLGFRVTQQALSVLPLAHIFERLLCYGYFQLGIPVAYGDPHKLADLMRIHEPAVIGCVPRILEKIRENVLEQISILPPHRRGIARALLRVSLLHGGTGILHSKPSLPCKVGHAISNLLVFKKVKRRMGGRLQYLICGGARLDPEVEAFFHAAGFQVLQGYGLTETSPIISLSPFGKAKPGTVGTVLDEVEVCFDEEGELLVRGENVTPGYYKDPGRTLECMTKGWFRTGDLGRLDDDGYLVITGRKKEIFVTSSGKNVSPGPIEEELRKSSFIVQAYVLGDARKFIAALIVPDCDKLAHRLAIAPHSIAQILEHPQSKEIIHAEIRKLQVGFAEWEKIKQFALIDPVILEDPELITPTQKLRRDVLYRKYAEHVEAIYELAQTASSAG